MQRPERQDQAPGDPRGSTVLVLLEPYFHALVTFFRGFPVGAEKTVPDGEIETEIAVDFPLDH